MQQGLSERMLTEWTDAFFAALGRGPHTELRHQRRGRLLALNELSDEDLREEGLSRELIPVAVFADLFAFDG